MDLFHEIEEAWENRPSLFDTIMGGADRRPRNGVFPVHLFLSKFDDAVLSVEP